MLDRNHPRLRYELQRERLRRSGGFNPQQVSAVAAWLRFASGTVTGIGFSSVPDLLASNPATQSTDANRPPRLLSANGFPTADFDGADDFLSWPAAGNNNQSVTSGVALWAKLDAINDGVRGFIGAITGATARFELIKSNADFIVNVHHSQFSSRRGAIATSLSANVWTFLTWEFDGGGANDAAKCVLTINGTVQTLTFTDDSGAPGAMPATLVTTAGPFTIGARNASALSPLNGKIGPNFYVLGSKMSGATQGLLTTAARAALMGFEQPT